MNRTLRRFCATITLAGWGAAIALAGDGTPPPPVGDFPPLPPAAVAPPLPGPTPSAPEPAPPPDVAPPAVAAPEPPPPPAPPMEVAPPTVAAPPKLEVVPPTVVAPPKLEVVPPTVVAPPMTPPPAPPEKAPAPVAVAPKPPPAMLPVEKRLPAPAPVAPAPPPPPTPVVAPSAPVMPAKADAPVEVPGLPPLPPAPKVETVDAGVPLGGESCERPCGTYFADFEYLYLKPYRSNLDYAIVSPRALGDPEGSIQSDPWHTRSAFRVGAGLGMANDGPDVGFYYTYLHDGQISGLVQPAGGQLFTTQTHPGTVELVGTAAAESALSYNVFDLEVGRRLSLGEAVSVRPFGGLRFAEIDQSFNVQYNGGDANQDTVSDHLKFDGGGVRAGAQVDWMLMDHWSVYGRAAGSLLVGDYHATVSEFNNAGATALTNVDQSFRKITPVAELGMGVSYHSEHLRLSLGYEITNWFGLVDTPSFVDDVQQGKFLHNVSDLGVDGLAVKAEFVY